MQQPMTQDWIERLSAHGHSQEAALSELSDLLKNRLKRALGTKAGVNESFLEDAVQDSVMKILGVLDQFQGKSQFTTWATTIAIRTAITEMRRHRWKDISLDQLVENQSAEAINQPTSQSVELDAGRKQFIGAMYQVIEEHLTDKQKTVLIAELNGMPQEEIGRRIGSNRNAIYKLAHDARKRLKKGLVSLGYSENDLVLFQGGSA